MSVLADNVTPQHSNLSKTFILCGEREKDKEG